MDDASLPAVQACHEVIVQAGSGSYEFSYPLAAGSEVV
jgi:hypothetical protein